MYTPPLLALDPDGLSRVCEGVVAREGLRKVCVAPFARLLDLQEDTQSARFWKHGKNKSC